MANPLAPRCGTIDGHLAAVAVVTPTVCRQDASPEVQTRTAGKIAQ